MSTSTEVATPGKQTTVTALKPIEQTPVHQLPAVSMGFSSLQSFELMQRAAKLLMASSLVPKDYQNNLPNCVIALNMAHRLGADPLMVMQNLYVVYGRPSWSAQFLIACFNQCGRYATMKFKWTGEKGKDTWGCTAYAKEIATGETIEGPTITIALAKEEGWYQKNGSKWKTIPQLMLMYRSAAWLVRTHAPELSMGLQTQEEIHDVYDSERGADGRYAVTTESLRRVTDSIDELAGQNSSNAPVPDPAAWVNTLNGQSTLAELEKGWQGCREAFANNPPNDCHAAYTARKEVLGEKEGKQLDL
jgi:hypothetical protein